jgi:LysM repeat protein
MRLGFPFALLLAALGAISCGPLDTREPEETPLSEVLPAQVAPSPSPPVAPSGESYTIEPGDTLLTVAERLGITLEALLEANPDIADPNLISVGQVIHVPSAAVVPTATAAREPTQIPVAPEEQALPDLTIVIPPLVIDEMLIFTVRNQGSGSYEGSLIQVAISDENDLPLATVTTPVGGLAPGQSIDVRTGLEAPAGQRLVAEVDPQDLVVESDESNNRLLVEVPAP